MAHMKAETKSRGERFLAIKIDEAVVAANSIPSLALPTGSKDHSTDVRAMAGKAQGTAVERMWSSERNGQAAANVTQMKRKMAGAKLPRAALRTRHESEITVAHHGTRRQVPSDQDGTIRATRCSIAVDIRYFCSVRPGPVHTKPNVDQFLASGDITFYRAYSSTCISIERSARS